MRRPKVLILLVLLLAVVACGDDYGGGGDRDVNGDDLPGQTHELTVDESEADARVGDTVVIRIDENASVGDDWHVTVEPEAEVLEPAGEDFESEGDCDGCGGTKVLSYDVVGEGEATVVLANCYRCTSDGEPSETPPEPAEVEFSVEVTA